MFAVLARRGIPFWAATGYGEMTERLQNIGARGLLAKPYRREELAQLVKELATLAVEPG